jgi:hypothetical protein
MQSKMFMHAYLLCLCVLSGVNSTSLYAKSDVQFYVELGSQGTKWMHAPGPEILKNQTKDADVIELKRLGDPKVATVQPDYFATSGIGSLVFDGELDQYRLDSTLLPKSKGFVLEAWAQADNGTHNGLHAVVAHGNGSRGFMIAQYNDQWVTFVGSKGAVSFGKVSAGHWEHLAAVYDNGSLTLYQNGKEVRQQSAGFSLAQNFSIGGVDGHSKECFAGKISAVRLSTFEKGKFGLTDLLLDYEEMNKIQESQLKAARDRIQAVIDTSGVEKVNEIKLDRQGKDWLIDRIDSHVQVLAQPLQDGTQAELTITNGLISRSFYISENLACYSYRNLSNEAQYLRSIQPEARIQLDGIWYDVGGLQGQKVKAYLLDSWLKELTDDGKGFQFAGMEIGKPKTRYPWHPRYDSTDAPWPPKGKRITMTYHMARSAKPEHRDLTVKIHYELYNGSPILCKYLEFENSSDKPVNVDRVETEILALQQDQVKRIHMESDFSCALVNREAQASDTQHLTGGVLKDYSTQGSTTKWRVEEGYHFYATHNQAEDKFLDFPHSNVLVSTIPVGPDQTIQPGGNFTPMHTFQLLHSSDDTERRSLAHRRMYCTIAPQVTEHIISCSISSADINVLKPYIDHVSELGFEALSLSYPGVRISHDRVDDKYINTFKQIVDYSKSKGIGLVGAYELVFASRDRGAKNNVVHPETGKPGGFFGQSGCLATQWMDGYSKRTLEFFDRTGFKMTLWDGPYHGEPCASTQHKNHKGINDSQYRQWQNYVELMHDLLERDVYIPIPDWYFLNGQSCTSMGYREAAFGLPANLQMLLYRQYIYDGTWHKIPPMGWIEFNVGKLYPYKDNLRDYERWLVQGLGCGARIDWRSNGSFYDTEETKTLVKGWLDWFRKHREILTSDIIHLGRPSGRDLDAIFHVNPFIEERGLALIFNPTEKPMTRDFHLPLYYSGVDKEVSISIHTGYDDPGTAQIFELDRNYTVTVPVTVPAQGHIWLLIKEKE